MAASVGVVFALVGSALGVPWLIQYAMCISVVSIGLRPRLLLETRLVYLSFAIGWACKLAATFGEYA